MKRSSYGKAGGTPVRCLTSALLAWAVIGCSGRDSDFGGAGPGDKIDPNDSTLNHKIRPIDASKPFDTLRVADFNMSIGFPVSQLLFVEMTDPKIAYDNLDTLFARYQRGKPRERLKAMAKTIVAENLDVVGLQEVMKIAKDGVPVDDFLPTLLQEIQAQGGPAYQSFHNVLNDTNITGKSGDKTIAIHFSEGNALLIRPGFQILAQAKIMYDFLLPIPVPDNPQSQRCINYARLRSPKGIFYQIYNTHLEVMIVYSSSQTQELRRFQDSLKLGGHVQIVMGDFNAEAPKDAHGIMAEAGWLDTFAGKSVGDTGTCCVANSQLWNPKAAFSNRRIDFIFARRIGGVLDSRTLFTQPHVTAAGDSLWVSDHRMVVVRLLAQ